MCLLARSPHESISRKASPGWQIRALFNRHVSKERIDLALEQLMTLGLINSETSGKRGRPATLWAKVEDPKVAGPETYGA
jgi:hypothetical protein